MITELKFGQISKKLRKINRGPEDLNLVYSRFIHPHPNEHVAKIISWFRTQNIEGMDLSSALKICYAIFVEKFLISLEGKRSIRKLLLHLVKDLE